MIGDRLETDIEGAARLGWDSMLVLTGIASRADLEDVGDEAHVRRARTCRRWSRPVKAMRGRVSRPSAVRRGYAGRDR